MNRRFDGWYGCFSLEAENSAIYLRLSEVPPAVGNASGLRSGPAARLEAWKKHQSPNTSHAVSRKSANTVDTADSTSDRLRLNGFLAIKLAEMPE